MNPNVKKLSNESIFEYNFIGELEELKKNIKKKSKERIEEIEQEKQYILRHSILISGIEEMFEERKEYFQKGVQQTLEEIDSLKRELILKDERREKE